MRGALHDAPVFRDFVGLTRQGERAAQRFSAILRFFRLLERRKPAGKILRSIADPLSGPGLSLKVGVVVKAAPIATLRVANKTP